MLKKASRGSEKQKIKMCFFANWVQGEALVDRGRGKEYDEKKLGKEGEKNENGFDYRGQPGHRRTDGW